ncbi:unnamed protein product [Chilo suppressalis]|uniref:C2H2-type domain-containing protein n=1 Tax=Chilo suppressalis TaxID=168631 RepID=A0ABN8BCL5_CHISP|nr:unnamed protein product [Chilo suppressalis]
MLTCEHCKVLYPNRTLLLRHINRDHSEQSEPNTNAEHDKTITGPGMQGESPKLNDQEIKPQISESISKSGTQKIQPNSSLQKCEVCTETCANMTKLWLHIRKEHFNLQAKLPYCDQKKVNQFTSGSMPTLVCNLCAHLLKKFNKFKQQCQIAYDILNEAEKEDRKMQFYTKLEVRNLYDLRKSDVQLAEFANENSMETLYTENIMFDHDIYVDDDEVPLVMLKTEQLTTEDKFVKKKKRKRRHSVKNGEAKENEDNVKVENNLTNSQSENNIDSVSMTNGEIKEEINDIEVEIKEEKSTKQKTLREGFTSRMVQETDEYTVIKLSKEQVLKEMEEKLRSEEYLRSLYKCEKCAKGFNFEDVLKSHMEKHAMKKGWLLCDLCEQYCPSIVSLRGHMKSHTTRYKCKVCGCVRLSRQVLLEHHSNCHTADTMKYTCQLCDFVTSKRTSMQRHIRTRHHKTEKHPCDQCGKTLNSLEALRVHTTRHDKSKRFYRDDCMSQVRPMVRLSVSVAPAQDGGARERRLLLRRMRC